MSGYLLRGIVQSCKSIENYTFLYETTNAVALAAEATV
jgi:hypothetical protein